MSLSSALPLDWAKVLGKSAVLMSCRQLTKDCSEVITCLGKLNQICLYQATLRVLLIPDLAQSMVFCCSALSSRYCFKSPARKRGIFDVIFSN